MENQHQMIKGYRDLTQTEIDGINTIKEVEQNVGQIYKELIKIEGIDHRWAAIAKTHFEEGFSAWVRSIAKPEPRF